MEEDIDEVECKRRYCLKIVEMVNSIIDSSHKGIPVDVKLAMQNAEICMTLLEEVVKCHAELAEISESLSEMPFILKMVKKQNQSEECPECHQHSQETHGKN
jgi:hypothetical protein